MDKVTDITLPEGALTLYYDEIGKENKESGLMYSIIEEGKERTVVLCKSCVWLKTMYIPSSVKYISKDMLRLCTRLEYIEVHKDNTKYYSEDGILYNKAKSILIKCPERIDINYFIIKNTVRKIEKFAFIGCRSIKELYAPKQLGERLVGITLTLDNLEAVHVDKHNHMFSSFQGILMNKIQSRVLACPRQKSGAIDIPDTVVEISSYAFYMCKNITQVTIPEGVQTIGTYAFADIPLITEITMPSTLKKLEKEPFAYMWGLKKVVFKSIPIRKSESFHSEFQASANIEEIVLPEGGEMLLIIFFFHKNIKTITFGNRRFHSRIPFDIDKLINRLSMIPQKTADPVHLLISKHCYDADGNDKLTAIAAAYDFIFDKNENAEKYIQNNLAKVLCLLCMTDNAELLREVLKRTTDRLSENEKSQVIDAAINNTQNGGSAEVQIIVMNALSDSTSLFDSLTL